PLLVAVRWPLPSAQRTVTLPWAKVSFVTTSPRPSPVRQQVNGQQRSQMSYEQPKMSSFQRIGDKHLIGDKEGTPQKQRGREGQVHGLSCRTAASKAPACPPEQHSGDPLPEYDACEQDGIYGGRISVPCCCFLNEFPIAGCESPGFVKQAKPLASVGQ